MPKIIRNGVTYSGIPNLDYDCEMTSLILYAANWTDGVYTITDSRIDLTTVQEYMPGLGITDTQLEALQAANICDFGQDTGHAYLKAYGDTPSIDIPIRVMFNPGVKTKEVEQEIDAVPYPQFNSWTNVAVTTSSTTYTTTSDCWVRFRSNTFGDNNDLWINGVSFLFQTRCAIFPVKAGTTITIRGTSSYASYLDIIE